MGRGEFDPRRSRASDETSGNLLHMMARTQAYWTGPNRARLVALAFCVVFTIVGLRASWAALFSDAYRAPVLAISEQAPERRQIVDRNGELLASPITIYRLSANPQQITDPEEVAAQLSTELPYIDPDRLFAQLSDRSRRHVWLAYNITPRKRQAIFDLGLPGIFFETVQARSYPRGKLAGHLLGAVGREGKGLSGIELAFDEQLAAGGEEPLRLSIDVAVQSLLEAGLMEASERFGIVGGSGIVLDVHTGEVLAMASFPFLDPHRYAQSLEEVRRNRAIGGVYELGSIYKSLTIASGIEAGELRPADRFPVAQPIRIGSRTVTDSHRMPEPVLDVTAILAHSSNIGTVQIAELIGSRRHKDFLSKAGLFERVPINLQGAGSPILPPRTVWSTGTLVSVSFGYGLSVSPMSFIRAFAAFGNDGEMPALTVLARAPGEVVAQERLMSAPTARVVLEMMRDTVRVGTAKNIAGQSYDIAGKTGTAEKVVNGQYDKGANVASFAAIFPAHSPKYVVLLVLDDPRTNGKSMGGGTAAAPIVGRLVDAIAPILGVEPIEAAPVEPDVLRVRAIAETAL
jgi:cell division protein FtsI (penicillin-binding protein 3)